MPTMPSISHSFSVHLLNCYFPNFWYSNVSENGKERYTMRKKQDVIWETSTLWEQVCIHGVRYLVFLEKQVLSSEQDVGRAVLIDYFINTAATGNMFMIHHYQVKSFRISLNMNLHFPILSNQPFTCFIK